MEQDITYNDRVRQYEDDDSNSARKNESTNSLAEINEGNRPNEEQQEEYYDEFDRKCTIRKSGTTDSKIILHRARTHFKGKKIYDISVLLLGIIGLILLVLYIIICARGGWAKANIYDIDSGNRTALLLLSIFIIFISFVGLMGSYTYWKPIILMTTLLSVLGFVSHCYVAKQFYDITRFADRDMALPWWDIYTDDQIKALQREFGCCGYKDYQDRAFVTENCPQELVEYKIPEDIYIPASVKKNDSYRRKFGEIKTDDSNTTGDNNNAGNTENTGNTGNTGNANDDNADEENDLWRRKKRGLNVIKEDMREEVIKEIGEDIKKSLANGKGKIFMDIEQGKKKEKRKYEPVFSKKRITRHVDFSNEIDYLTKRQEADQQGVEQQGTDQQGTDQQGTEQQGADQQGTDQQGIDQQGTDQQGTELYASPGCRHFIVEKVESSIVPIYIALFVFLIVYIVIFVFSIIYWIDLRNEKEYDEFS